MSLVPRHYKGSQRQTCKKQIIINRDSFTSKNISSILLQPELSIFIRILFFPAGRPPPPDQYPWQRDRDPAEVQRGPREPPRHGKSPLFQNLRLASQPYQQVHKSW